MLETKRHSLSSLPQEIKEDLDIAKEILLKAGAREIYVFGSFADGSYRKDSDIDLAVVDLEKSRFFEVYGTLLSKLSHPVDLVGLDYQTDFSDQLKQSGTLLRIA